MAWNEPGGNSNNQDPWGGRKGGDRKGPPDLDEAFRKLQESLNGLFGGGKKRGSDDGGGAGGFVLLGVGLVVLLGLVSTRADGRLGGGLADAETRTEGSRPLPTD